MSEDKQETLSADRITYLVVRVVAHQGGQFETPVLSAATEGEANEAADRKAQEMQGSISRSKNIAEIMQRLGIIAFRYEVRAVAKYSNVILAPPGSRLVMPS